MAYDGAGRLVQQAMVPDPLAQVPNNSTLAGSVLDAAATATRFAYDAAQNLISREERDEGVESTVSLPIDASGRNRPASVNGQVLEYDLNGNLTRKGNQRYKYDFRNRLTQVTDLGGTEIARYAYDADNRRVSRIVGGDTIETVWDRLQALEHYRNGQLETRMTYGTGLDEVIALEVDLDGDGTLEPPLTPIYDASGNLVLLTDENGKPVERMTYSPYGDRTIRVDVTPPAVEQVRVVGDQLWLEVSEEVLADSLATAFAAGQVRLIEDATSTELTLLSAEQPVKTGRQAGRRIVLTLDTPPAVATAVTLTIEAAALVDPFLNRAAAHFAASFAWPGADAVLVDTAPPVLQEVRQEDGHLEVELSEPVDPSTFGAGLLIDGASATWTTDATGYRLRADAALAEGSHTIAITTALEDLEGEALAEGYSETIAVSFATPIQVLFVLPDQRITPSSTTANTLAFHGRPVDLETGFVYFRNRFFDTELARFISADPLGYVDGPSQYIFAGYDPVNMGDPLGLYELDTHNYLTRYLAERAGFSAEEAEKLGFQTQELDMDLRVATAGGVSHENMETYHFVEPGRMIEMRRKAHSADSLESGYVAIGEFLHAWEDSYSHQRHPTERRFSMMYEDFGVLYDLGHGLHGHNPDWTWERPELAMRMAESTYRQLVVLCGTYKGDCQSEDFESFRDVVESFVQYEPSQYVALGMVPTVGDYRLKIRELDPDYELTQDEFDRHVRAYIDRLNLASPAKDFSAGLLDLFTKPLAWRRLVGAP